MRKFVDYLEAKRPEFLPKKGQVMGAMTRIELGTGEKIDVPYGARTNANFSKPLEKSGRVSAYGKMLNYINDHGPTTRKTLMDLVKIESMSFGRYAKDLVDLGILTNPSRGVYAAGKNFKEYIKYGKQVAAEIEAALANKAGHVKATPKKFQD